jgi:hypothetical protein
MGVLRLLQPIEIGQAWEATPSNARYAAAS